MRTEYLSEAVRKVLAEFPNHPSKTLARILCDREPILFPDLELARSNVRRVRGNYGQHSRNLTSRKDFFRPNGKQSDGSIPLPEPVEADSWKVVVAQFKRGLVISDVHIPFHDATALRLALDHGKKFNADAIIINGDLMDFYRISFWEKDPRSRSLSSEIEAGKLFLEHLRDRFPKAQIIFKEGNHEERLWRYAWSRCPEMFTVRDGSGREFFKLATLMDAAEYRVQVVDNKQPLRCGEHLHLLHGHEFRSPFQNPVNPARGLYLRAKCNALCGDLHQTSQHTESGLTHSISCWSVGGLCNMHPAYMPLNKWNLGFATIELDGDAWSVENKKIIRGRVV